MKYEFYQTAVITVSVIIAAFNFSAIYRRGFVASIVSMSLGGGRSDPFNSVVNELVSQGVIVVTASGNDGADGCFSSPGSAGDNINVGAHSEPEESHGVCTDPIESFSNYGECVHVIAPGRDILSVDYKNNFGKCLCHLESIYKSMIYWIVFRLHQIFRYLHGLPTRGRSSGAYDETRQKHDTSGSQGNDQRARS